MILVTKSARVGKDAKSEVWDRLPGDPTLDATEEQKSSAIANRRLVDDWLDAIRNDREPICSGKAATAAIEMVMGVYQSAIGGEKVRFPLSDRRHPLAK